MYELVDQSWKNQPKKMAESTITQFFMQLEDYIVLNELNRFSLVLHGGEPLLAEKSVIESVLLKASIISKKYSIDINCSLQTNAILLDKEWIDLFKKFSCLIGISHDGPAQLNDVNRQFFSGSGTESFITEKIHLIKHHAPEIFSGVLTVINPSGNGADVVDYFYGLGVPKIDFLLPDQNHVISSDSYPSASDSHDLYTSYLIQAYTKWRQIDDPNFDIRIFREIVLGVLGRQPMLDSLGLSDVGIFVLETDGGLEPIDTFKCCGESYTKLNLNISNSSLEDLENHPSLIALVNKSSSLSTKCLSCEYLEMCGGGYMPHRFNGFDFKSPSVYCNTLFSLCSFIKEDINNAISTATSVSKNS